MVGEPQDAVGRRRADEAVGRGNRAGRGRAARSPGDRADVLGRAVPHRAADDVVAIGQRRDTADADVIGGKATDQAVRRADLTVQTSEAVGPGDCSRLEDGTVAPEGADHDVVAVGQRGNACDADVVARADIVSAGAPDQAVGCGNDSVSGRRTRGPSDRTNIGNRTVVPERTVDHVVAVGQPRDGASVEIATVAADQAVARRDRAAGHGLASGPGDSSDIDPRVVPEGAADDVVAVGQGCRAVEADHVVGRDPDQTVGRRHGVMGGRGARSPGDCANIGGRSVVPEWAADDVVAIGQRGDAATADAVVGGRAGEAVPGTDRSAETGGTGCPRSGAGIDHCALVPRRGVDDVVAIREGGHRAPREVEVRRANQAVGRADLAGETCRAVDPRRCTDRCRPVVPRGAEDHEVARADLRHAVRPDLIASNRAGGPTDRQVGCPVVEVHRPDVRRCALVEQAVDDHVVAVRQDEYLSTELRAAGILTEHVGARRSVCGEGAEADHHCADHQRRHGGGDRSEARTNQ